MQREQKRRQAKAKPRNRQSTKAVTSGTGGARRAGRDKRAPAAASSRKVDAAARRQAILDAALTAFAERGYEAARLDDVAAKAGVAKGTLYLYFKDKQALFEALVRGAVSPILGQ